MVSREQRIIQNLKRQERREPIGTDVYLPNLSGVKDSARKDRGAGSGDVSVTDLALADGNIIVGDSNGVAQSVNPSGDVDVSNSGVFSIASGAVVNADVNANAAIDFSKLAALTDGNILVGNSSNVATSVNPSGDVDISNTGVFTVSDLTIASEAQGDILYFNGTNWVRLAAGTSGQFLKTNGAAQNPAWAAAGALQFVSDTTASAAENVELTGLSGTAYLLVGVGDVNGVNDWEMTLNSITAGEYDYQYHRADGATNSTAEVANGTSAQITNNITATGFLVMVWVWVDVTNSRLMFRCEHFQDGTFVKSGGRVTDTSATSVSAIKIATGNGAHTFDGHFYLYKLSTS